MKISYNWLKEYVDIKIPVERLAGILTMAGLTVDSIEKKLDDSVFEVEVTSNRPDWLSYIGVAREVAAITGRKLKTPVVKLPKGTGSKVKDQVNVKVENKTLCPRYTARVIRNVKVGESPEWLKKKIESMGLRPVNNIADITNFCLFETGEPMHAFDLNNLTGETIIVRNAKPGEKIMVIDGTERLLNASMLVIADTSSPVAVAGVMGGLKSEVGAATKDILLEAAYFDPVSIRRTSRALALATESSYRFERKVDLENIKYASDRATQLILEIAGGEAGEFIDIWNKQSGKRTVNLRYKRLNKIIGADIPPATAKNILLSLGLKAKVSTKDNVRLEIPLLRKDLEAEIDLIEEVTRIYGYGNIPETLPAVVEKGERVPLDMIADCKMRHVLASLGFSEIITYSLLSKKLLNAAKINRPDIIEIKNPLSAEQEIMRPSSIPGMLVSMRHNINRKSSDLKLFELGKVYFKESNNIFKEKRNLSIGMTGVVYDGWLGKSRDATFFDLKGTVETLFLALGLGQFSTRESENDTFSFSVRSSIELKGEPVGIMGEINGKVANNFDIKNKIYVAEIDCEALIKLISLEKKFHEPPKYPSVIRDISVVMDKNILNSQIISLIEETAGKILKKAELIDRYHGGQIPDGKIGLTYRLEYLDLSKTLTDRNIQETHSRIIKSLEDNLRAKLR